MYIPDDNCTIINFQTSRFNEKITARNTHEDYDHVYDFANTDANCRYQNCKLTDITAITQL